MLDLDETPDMLTKLKRQVANPKSMMSKLMENTKNKTGGASWKNGKGNTTPFNPYLIWRPSITIAQGPFHDGKLPIQCHKCHGWVHTWRKCPTSLNLVWDENDKGPLSQNWRASQQAKNPRRNQAPLSQGTQNPNNVQWQMYRPTRSWGRGI